MMTSSMFCIEPLHLHLTGSTSEGFVDCYGVMEQIKKFKLKLKMLPWDVTHGNTKYRGLHIWFHAL